MPFTISCVKLLDSHAGLTAQYGISNTSFGIVIGIGSLVYGLSRFINGFIVDRFSARVIMAIGLLLCALSNLAFGFGVNISGWITGVGASPDFINMLVMVMAVTIICNQLFQGVGYPPCARLLPCWIHPLAACHKDVYMEYLTFNWSGTRCCRMRIHNGNYGYRPQF